MIRKLPEKTIRSNQAELLSAKVSSVVLALMFGEMATCTPKYNDLGVAVSMKPGFVGSLFTSSKKNI